MRTFRTRQGVTVSYTVHGEPDASPLVLVHGSFSDHHSNWQLAMPELEREFSVYAIARRGRGRTAAAPMRRVEDEAQDVADLIRSIDAPVSLLGHSYGAHVALLAAASIPAHVRRLILYEPPSTGLLPPHMPVLESLAAEDAWSDMSYRFFRDVLLVPVAELDELRKSELWAPIVRDAPPTLGDLRALSAYSLQPYAFRTMPMPVLLQTGSESPGNLYATDTLAAVLPHCRVEILAGQAHEAMTTSPAQYVDSVKRFLREAAPA